MVKSPSLIRILQGIIVSLLWITYTAILAVIGSVISNVLILISGIISIIRLDIIPLYKRKNSKQSETIDSNN